MSHVVWLQQDEVVNVPADVKAQHAKFNRSDPRVSGKRDPSGKDEFNDVLKQPPGTPPPGSPPRDPTARRLSIPPAY